VPGSLREGDRFTTVSKFLGRRFETPFEVTAHEPNRQHSHRSTGGPLPQEYTSTFEETAGGGTRMTQVVEGEPGSRPTWRRSRTFWKRRALHKYGPAEGGLP
jgi:hypothetical protein